MRVCAFLDIQRSFSALNHDLFNAPLGRNVAFAAPLFAYDILGHCGHARSHRRASAGRGQAPLIPRSFYQVPGRLLYMQRILHYIVASSYRQNAGALLEN